MADISNITVSAEGVDTVCKIKDKVARNDIALNRTTLGTQCKNLLDVRNYASKYTAGVTASPNGVDGLTFSGTANNTFYLAWNDKAFSLKKGDYILSYAGDITSDKPNNTFLRVRKSDNTIICDLPLSQTSKSFSLNADDELYFIAVYTNVTANVQGTIKPMLRYADIIDDTFEPYQPSLQEQINNFGVQQQLLCDYSSAATSSATIQITGLFSNYSAVICIVKYSYGTINTTLPLKYIKSIGTSKEYSPVSDLNFQYVDDDNLFIGGADAAISNVKIISLY